MSNENDTQYESDEYSDLVEQEYEQNTDNGKTNMSFNQTQQIIADIEKEKARAAAEREADNKKWEAAHPKRNAEIKPIDTTIPPEPEKASETPKSTEDKSAPNNDEPKAEPKVEDLKTITSIEDLKPDIKSEVTKWIKDRSTPIIDFKTIENMFVKRYNNTIDVGGKIYLDRLSQNPKL